jgi:hypothetical protein
MNVFDDDGAELATAGEVKRQLPTTFCPAGEKGTMLRVHCAVNGDTWLAESLGPTSEPPPQLDKGERGFIIAHYRTLSLP